MINHFRSLRILNTRSNAWSALVNQSRSVFNYQDPFLLETQLTGDEKTIKDVASNFSKNYLLPNVVSSFRHEKFDINIIIFIIKSGVRTHRIYCEGCISIHCSIVPIICWYKIFFSIAI